LLQSSASKASEQYHKNSQNNQHLQTIFSMVAMRTLLAVLPLFLSVATALPSDTTGNGMLAPAPAVADENGNSNVDFAADAAAWNVSASSGKVDVEFYEDKNPDKNTRIDANTCNGQADIALMKWRAECKTGNAIFRKHCYSHAPSHVRCCPVPKSKSCAHYWPAPGE
jgi:hypothetical protein